MKRSVLFLLLLFFVLAFAVTSFADLNYGLMAYYPFNGNANDESGNGNDAIVTQAILDVDRFGNENSAYYFDGLNSYMDTSFIDSETLVQCKT
jgi:hypothetical protein